MRLAILAAALLATTPAFAVDAITYKGTLGTHEIVVELASETEGKMVGRYSYLNQGGDIPLTFMGRIGTPVLMAEEAPCADDTCEADDEGNVFNPPLGAIWSLEPSDGGHYLTGIWEPAGKSGKTLDISLEQVARRTLPDDEEVSPYGLRMSALKLIWAGERSFSAETAPYEFAKQEVPFTAGPDLELEGSTYRYVTDPRSRFSFPRVVALADGSPVDPVNQALEIRHAILNTFAFDCMALVYPAFGATQDLVGFDRGTLGGFDMEEIAVSYLTPTVISWTESGSTFCGGAHPNNHSDGYTLDVKTGETFPMAKVFKDWVPQYSRAYFGAEIDLDDAMDWPGNYVWGPGPDLIDFVIARRPIEDDDIDCGTDDLIASNLAIRFAPGGAAVFSLEQLPHAIGACLGSFMTIKLGDDPELLAPTAGDYFPELAQIAQ